MSRIYQPANTKPAANSAIPSGSSSIGSSSVSMNNNNNNNNKNTQLNSTQNNLSNDKKASDSHPQSSTQSKAEGIKMTQDLDKLLLRLENVTSRLESISHNNTSSSGRNENLQSAASNSRDNAEDIPSIVAFDELLKSSFQPLKELSAKVGDEVKQIVDLVEKALKLERNFLLEASGSTQPEQKVLVDFFQHFSKQLQEVQNFREKNRKSQLFNHLSAISESIGALGWLAIQPAPTPYIKEMSDSAQFYTNRVLKDYKDKDANHSNWVKLWLQLLSNLHAYVKEYHTTGVSWNTTRKSGKFDLTRLTSSSGPKENATTSSGPAPPPPPPIPNFTDLLTEESKSTAQPVASNTEALFAELNKGSDITKTLKKVSDDQKTHKNPNLRAGHTVPSDPSTSTTSSIKSNKSIALQEKKTPVFKLVEKKWLIEYQEGRHDLTIEETELKQTVYIYKCSECTITVKGKVNSISVDSCSRVGLIFDDVLSTVEFVNCQNVQTQVLGKVPTVSIEKTDGCQVFLSRHSVESEIVSSKSSAMNILIPNNDDDEYTEHPIPEQFKTVYNKSTKRLLTSATETA